MRNQDMKHSVSHVSSSSSAPAPAPLSVRPRVLVALCFIAFAASLLALFQWMELLVLHSGGKTVCGLSGTVNCEAVWKSPLAVWLHGSLKVPVAGLGLVWGFVAFGLGLRLFAQRAAGVAVGSSVVAVRLTALVGVLASLGFAAAAVLAKAVCLTCLGTYALVLGFALVAWFGLSSPRKPGPGELGPALGWSAGLALLGYLAALGPGMATPVVAPTSTLPAPPVLSTPAQGSGPAQTGPSAGAPAKALDARTEALQGYLGSLPPAHQQALSDSLAAHRASPSISAEPARRVLGPADAPVKIVEFTDILCGHCGELVKALASLKKMVPSSWYSLEARQFPLDGACNSEVSQRDPQGLRCFAAKVIACLEEVPDYWELREKLFAEQRNLSTARVLELATSSGSFKQDALLACVQSPATDAKLKADVAYAMKTKPPGTPIVLVNGRVGTPVPAYLYSMIVTGADAQSPVFGKLPAPRAGGAHAGHGH